MNNPVVWALLVFFLWVTWKATVAAVRLWLERRTPPGSREDYERNERAAMPPEIAAGKLVVNERTLWRRGARPFAAKTDQVFLTPQGMLVPVETKARRRVYDSDIIQLSCQAVALAHTPGLGGRPASWGYVRLSDGGRATYKRVDLVPEATIDMLWDRWDDLRRGREQPIVRPAYHRCTHCQARTRCRDAVLNRPDNRRG